MTSGQARVTVPGATVFQAIEALDHMYPGVREHLCKDGELEPEIRVAVDGVISTAGLEQPLTETSEVRFVSAISGGSAP